MSLHNLSADEPEVGTPSLAAFSRERLSGHWYNWAFENYKRTVQEVVKTYACRNLLEIGGGRSPLLSQAEAQALGVAYTVNDISQRELDLAPAWVHKTCFDFAGNDAPAGSYDLVFSRMVMEHVSDASRAYRNLYRLLKDGGLALHFHPNLFAAPFIINYLLPDSLSRKVLSAFGKLTDSTEEYPKFPAHYSWCRNSESIRRRIGAIGFSEVEVASFYGHGYFNKIPGLRQIDDAWSSFAQKQGMGAFSSYAFTMVRR